MQEICTSLMVVCALFTYCVFCYIDTSMLICINHSASNNVQFIIGSGPSTGLEEMVSRSGYLAEYTAQGNFRQRLGSLRPEVPAPAAPTTDGSAMAPAALRHGASAPNLTGPHAALDL